MPGFTCDALNVVCAPTSMVITSDAPEVRPASSRYDMRLPVAPFHVSDTTPPELNVVFRSAGADGGSGDGHLIYWDVATGREEAKIKADEKWVLGAGLSADGKTLVTTGEDKVLRIWDVPARKEIRKIPLQVAVVGDG